MTLAMAVRRTRIIRRTILGIERRCPRCRQFWPEDAEFFSPATKRGRPTWFPWCRACKAEYDAERRRR